MALKDLVIRSQLVPPRQRKGVLRRPRLEARMAAMVEHPLTVVQAGTGYGKSTALAALSSTLDDLFWYTITERDREPLLFLAHLACAFEWRGRAWCEPSLIALEEMGSRVTPEALTPLLNALTLELDGEAVLVLDDYHLVDDVPEIAALLERLVDYAPPRLHVVISTRQMPSLEAMSRWRVKGQMLAITRADLAFTASEIETLFREQYERPLSPEQAQALASETEGWVIALQMVWQSLQSDAVPGLDSILGQLPSTFETLFDYLAKDVLARQPPEIQRFLLATSVLRQMDRAACEALLEGRAAIEILDQLHESGLFVVAVGDEVYRYHRLFHDFLQTHLRQDPAEAQRLHRRAAAYFRSVGQLEETVHHLLEAEDYAQAAQLLGEIGPRLLASGRFDSLSTWIARLPEEMLAAQPDLHLLLGDLLRLRANFDEALDHYVAAERLYVQQREQLGQSHALRGQAQVYLDTVRPLKADSLLEEALRLLEPEEHRKEVAALLDRLAENKLNLGSPDEAQALHHEARLLRAETDPGDVYLEARAMVRTGRLEEARKLLERRAEEERRADEDRREDESRPQRFHRETLLLLALVHVLHGDAEAAQRCARLGITTGQQLRSPFVEAVGTMRLGHAIQLAGSGPWEEPETSAPREATACYLRAIEQVRAFKVMRTQVEPLWGLCRAAGYHGELGAAEEYADQALQIAARAGDEWICHLVQVTLGASHVLSHQAEKAGPLLLEAVDGFSRVGDLLGQSAALLWLALGARLQGDASAMLEYVSDLLPLVREHGYEFLLTRRTFIGLKDDQAFLPILFEARAQGRAGEYAGRLLEGLGLDGTEYHPGYTLRVRALGPFVAWRGARQISARDWQREKARQVFQLLLTCRGQWFYREQIVDQLWPHLPPEAAERDFKVALNAVNRALEPERPRGAQPFFVIRKGNVYGINPASSIVVDVDEFQTLAGSDDVAQLRRALALYEDDYLPDSLYEDWSAAERQRLRHLYLTTAERLARHLLRAGEWDETVQVCERILARDNCWEAAYRLLMQVYAAQTNRSQLHSVYQRCARTLSTEMGVEPSPTTEALFERLS